MTALLLLSAVLTAFPPFPSQPARVTSLDGTWDFSLLASNGVQTASGTIDVPSSWEMRGYGQPRYDADISGEVGIYRRTFRVPDGWSKDDPVFLRFDGVQFGAEVTLNGVAVASFTSSFNAHVFNVTSVLRRTDDNELIIRTNGHPHGAAFDTNDDWTLHGIHRSVTLFTLPKTHVRSWRIITSVNRRDATVRVTTELSQPGRVGVRLLAPQGAEVAAGEGTNVIFTVRNADLWTAETPSLYTLEFSVCGERLVRRVGLREVTWSDGVLKLNGRPIELRGVNHHDLSPVNGRAMTAAEQRRDVELIRAANANFIRTSHYPPSEALLDACDELGIYVMDEVPFGGGKKLVADAAYGSCLLERARLTVERDANRACVIAWSVGNEQKITPITIAALREVKRLDPTRPTCFPQQPNFFENHTNEKGMTDQGDMLNWHYPLIITNETQMAGQWFKRFDRPFVSGEFAHANGLDFGYLEDYMRLVRGTPSYAGGAVWMFQDQGIVRKREDIAPEHRESSVVTHDGRWYDSHGREGTDGIVYADRTPQTDYAELRQVYAPVQVEAWKGAGVEGWKGLISSHYDFVALDEKLTGVWRFVSDRRIVTEGMLDLAGIPARGSRSVRMALPSVEGHVRYVECTFHSKEDGRLVYSKTFPIGSVTANREPRTTNHEPGTTNHEPRIYGFAIDDATGAIRLTDADGRVLIDGVPLVRTDRRTMLGKDFSYAVFAKPWQPKVLAPKSFVVREPRATNHESRTTNHFICDYVYAPTNAPDARLDAHVAFELLSDRVRVCYELVQNVDRPVFETGLAFVFRQPSVRFEWVGLGPYETYPGTTALANFGIWSLDARDLRFVGNRHETQLLRLLLDEGTLGVLPVKGTDFAFERRSDGILLGANAVVGRKGCRFALPYDMRTIHAGERLAGTFDLLPHSDEAWDRIFGNRQSSSEVYRPFAHSYDQDR